MQLDRWLQIGRRITRMDRDELLFRLRHEFGSRQDAVLARAGYTFSSVLAKRPADQGKFFFAPESVQPILDILRQRIPGYTGQIVKEADQVCQHRFDLLGYAGLQYGTPIDWHLDAVHGKRAPKKSFYKIRYLDYGEVGDSKVTWELNRHQHLMTLAKAYRLTGNVRYVDEILRQWRHWWSDNPYPVGINWASSLEVAFRSLSWLWAYHLLQGSSGLPNFREEWLRGLAVNGRHIERNLSTYFSANTHLLGEGVALFFLGVLCPELAAAERWKALGWKIVLEEASRQVRADGFYFEQSTYYHVYALDLLLHTALLANVNGIQVPEILEDTIERMLTALSLLGRGGAFPSFGDDDGGRLFDSRRNRWENFRDPLATGAILFRRGDFKSAAGELCEETIWLVGPDGVHGWDALRESAVSNASTALGDSGYYLLSSGDRTQMVVTTGAAGQPISGHGHADLLSISLQSRGHALLIDPGTFEYVGSAGDRDRFRGTAKHNTVTVDRASQSEPAASFSWNHAAQPHVERWIHGKAFDLLVASHDGYQRLTSPVTHQRFVISFEKLFLVRDLLHGTGMHRLDIPWHLGEDLKQIGDCIFAVNDEPEGLAIIGMEEPGWTQELRTDSVSTVYGQSAPASVLNFSAEVSLPAEFAAFLVPLEDWRRFQLPSTRNDSASDVERAYQYSSAGGDYQFVFAQHGKGWQSGSLSSDAEFVGCRTSGNNAHLVLCGGSYAENRDGLALRCSKSVEWAELLIEDGIISTFSSEMTAVRQPETRSQRQSASPEPSESI